MAISGMVLGVAATMFVSTLQQNRTVTGKTTSSADARIAMEALTRNLRFAVSPGVALDGVDKAAFTVAGARTLTFYTSRGAVTEAADPSPSLVTYAIDTARQCLSRNITTAAVAADGSLSWTPVPAGATCVARGGINSDGSALFSYYPLVTTIAPSPGAIALVSGEVQSADLISIAGVRITLSDTDIANPAVKPTTVQTMVIPVNLINQLKEAATP